MIYKVFFQIYGKKLKIIIDADSEPEAMRKIRESIHFDKIVLVNDQG